MLLDGRAPQTDGEHRADVGIAGHAAERFGARGDLLGHEHRAAAEGSRRRSSSLRRLHPQHDPSGAGLVRRPVELHDHRRAQLLGGGGRLVLGTGPQVRSERDTGARQQDRGLVLGQRAATRRELADVRRGRSDGRPSRAPAGDAGEGERGFARAAEQRQVELPRELLDAGGWIGRVNRDHGREDVSALRGGAERAHDHLAPALLALPPELREVDLGDDDVEGAGAHEDVERSWEDLVLVGHGPGVEGVAGREEVRERRRQRIGEVVWEHRQVESRGICGVGEERTLTTRL